MYNDYNIISVVLSYFVLFKKKKKHFCDGNIVYYIIYNITSEFISSYTLSELRLFSGDDSIHSKRVVRKLKITTNTTI